ncbi:hypothetical protein QQG74_15075 [Micromonospora sp. FIMYZ51]|uniref:hypothetical protein n=1 Tax=Micromonospora sp. FIMYZ51 TaxID=3051832 RepID=UPI00311D9D8E
MNASTLTSGADVPRWSALTHRWPSLLGVATALLVLATGPDRETLATVVGVALLCYLGAAALDRPWVAWAAIPAGGLLIAASELTGLAWWAGLGVVALGLVTVGLLGRASRPALTAQTAALIGYGVLAVTSLFVAPTAGLVLSALVLIGHGAWDLLHYRRNWVVPRSLAEFCMLLDVPLGVGFLLLAAVN